MSRGSRTIPKALIKTAVAVLLMIVTMALGGCTHDTGGFSSVPDGDTITRNAGLLTVVDLGNGIVSAQISDPWNTGKTLGTYLLVNRDVPDDSIPDVKGASIIRVPVESALVYSSAHTGAFEEMGAADIVTGVADSEYFTSEFIRQGLKTGKIVDIGNSLAPSLDRIIDLDPQVIIVSPYENSGHGILEKTGITVIDMADYMETTPLGRAEWMVLLGALTGNLDKAREIYNRVADRYSSIKESAKALPSKPLVISEMPFSGVWYQPGGKSYASQLIRDAGGTPLLSSDSSAGSVQMDIANVYENGIDADFWIIKNAGTLRPADVCSASPMLKDIRAFRNGNIFVANTLSVPYYDDLAFHPERILSDMSAIFHGQTDSLRYFVRLSPAQQ